MKTSGGCSTLNASKGWKERCPIAPICTKKWQNHPSPSPFCGVNMPSNVEMKDKSPISTPNFVTITGTMSEKQRPPCALNENPENFWKWIGQVVHSLYTINTPERQPPLISLLRHWPVACTVMWRSSPI